MHGKDLSKERHVGYRCGGFIVEGHALLHFTKFSNLSSMVKSCLVFFFNFFFSFPSLPPHLVSCNDLAEVVIILTSTNVRI